MAKSERTRPPIWARVFAGARRYGAGFAIEVLVFWGMLVAYQQLGYGRRLTTSPPFTGPVAYYVLLGVLMVALAMGAAESRFRLYRRVWAVAGLDDALSVGLAVAEATLLITAANAVIPGDYRPYRLLVPLLAAPSVAALICFYRMLPRLTRSVPSPGNRLLLVVYGDRWYNTVKALVDNPNPDWKPVAILTTNAQDVHQTVMRIPVVGPTDDLGEWIERSKADGVAFIVNNRPVSDLHDLFAVCLNAELPIFLVPDAVEVLRPEEAGRLRPLATDDLVGRSQRDLEVEEARAHVTGRSVMVTGAAGSIGSELCRLLARLKPRRLVLVDNNESGLFDLAVELRTRSDIDIGEALVSVTDRELLLNVFIDERPDIVFHAAAYKHVPMLESHPEQAVLNNIAGTRSTLACAEAAGVQTFVMVSTDKAVARHSVMGSSKRACELLVLNHAGKMACWAVRFGNVVGSRGSVVPTFERQIAGGGPVTITHPRVTRYMMTIREAASLVITTLAFGSNGRLYMLDMGEPISILNLANSLIRSRGLRPGVDIELRFTGLRPGERLTEELLLPEEERLPTPHPAVVEVISSARPATDVHWSMEQLIEMAHGGTSAQLVRALKRSVDLSDESVPEDTPVAHPRGPRAPR
jgi:FlaA1/EpsC-like NDP-sugar epimerase